MTDAAHSQHPDVSVVVPVFNSASTLRELHDRITRALGPHNQSYEVVYVNDRSTDESLTVLRELHDGDSRVQVIDLVKNVGQHLALMCGLRHTSGDVVVTMDDDLQHPPEDIPRLITALDDGADAIFAAYDRKRQSMWANLGSALLLRVTRRVFRTPAGFKDSSFRAIRRGIVDAVNTVHTPFPYLSAVVLSFTTNVDNVPLTHQDRAAGRSGYRLRDRIGLAYNVIINHSAIPLRVMGITGLLASLGGIALSATMLIRQLVQGTAPPGWTSLVVVGSLFGAVISLMMVIVGEYLSRILRELSRGEAYTIREHLR